MAAIYKKHKPIENRTHIDFETYSEAPIKLGSYKYAEHPTTEAMIYAIARGDGEVLCWDKYDTLGQNEEAWAALEESIKKGDIFYAHNYQFEHAIFKYAMPIRPKIENWRCTMFMARLAALPQSLEDCADFLGLPQKKAKIGKSLIGIFSSPTTAKKKTYIFDDEKGKYVDCDTEDYIQKGERIHGNEEIAITFLGEPTPIKDLWKMFCEYCVQDVVVQREIEEALIQCNIDACTGDYMQGLKHVFAADARMNDRGVPVNIPALKKADTLVNDYQGTMYQDFVALTGFKPTQRAKVLAWLQDGGYPEDNTQAATVETVLTEDYDKLDEDCQKALKMYQLLSFAALKKIPTMIASACEDGRVRGTMMLGGAIRTLRWTGKIIQPHNMRKASIPHTDIAYDMIRSGLDCEDLDNLWGAPFESIASCIRHFIGIDDRQFIDVDYANIEARILPWLAGADWKLDLFSQGKDLYKVLAAKIFKIEESEVSKPQRFFGKIGELSAGYQTGIDTFCQTLADWGHMTPENEIDDFMQRNAEQIEEYNRAIGLYHAKDATMKTKKAMKEYVLECGKRSLAIRMTTGNRKKNQPFKNYQAITRKTVELYLRWKMAKVTVDTYRESNPEIVALWKEFDKQAKEAIKNPGQIFAAAGGKIHFMFLTAEDVAVPSLFMRLPSGHNLVYPKAYLKTESKKFIDTSGETRDFETESIRYMGTVGSATKFVSVSTYGACLVENACQAIGGDFLSNGIVVAEKNGYETFMIVHDQALCLYEEGKGHTVKGYGDSLCDLPKWAEDFPLEFDGGIVNYYTKD